MLSDEWLSRYGLLENFNTSEKRTRTGTGTWTTGVTAIALCTSCSRAKKDKCDPANYRPIALTCILCKVLEHIVASSIARHLNENDILYGLQHGFREKRSCKTQLLELVEKLYRKVSNCDHVDLVLLDFSKAFDTFNHLKLLFKLSTHGIKGNLKMDQFFSWGSNPGCSA